VLLLSGDGIITANLLATPNRVDFDSVLVGNYVGARLAITNQGPSRFALSGFSIAGPDAGSFTINSFLCDGATAYNTLPADHLGARQSCHLVLTYLPTSPGSHRATLLVSSQNGLVADFEVPLRGAAK
jgi:hypothetical protein